LLKLENCNSGSVIGPAGDKVAKKKENKKNKKNKREKTNGFKILRFLWAGATRPKLGNTKRN